MISAPPGAPTSSDTTHTQSSAYYQYNPASVEQPMLLHTGFHMPAVDEMSLAGSGIQLSLSAVTSRSSGQASAHLSLCRLNHRLPG
jgi:hypothetical protein